MKKEIKAQVVDAKRLFYFSEVFKRGSLNAVADQLDMAQAGIGRQIQLLEQELGVRLFERGTRGRGMVPGGQGRGMVPTEAAQIVYDYYQQYCDWKDNMAAALQEWLNAKKGTISLAIPDGHIDMLMENVLNNFCREYSHLNIHVEAVNTNTQAINKVLNDSVHIGLIFHYEDSEDIRCCSYMPLPIYLLVNNKHPLANKRKVNFAEISHYPLALPPVSFSFRKMLQSIEYSEKVELIQAFTSDSTFARKRFAMHDYGATLLSSYSVGQEIKLGQLIPIEIDHPAFKTTQLCFIVRRGRIFSPVINKLLKILSTSYQWQKPVSIS